MQQKSEVARCMHLIQLEREATERGLCGLAEGTARHAFLEARAARGADAILHLMQEGKHAEAIALMETPDWGVENSADKSGPPVATMTPGWEEAARAD